MQKILTEWRKYLIKEDSRAAIARTDVPYKDIEIIPDTLQKAKGAKGWNAARVMYKGEEYDATWAPMAEKYSYSRHVILTAKHIKKKPEAKAVGTSQELSDWADGAKARLAIRFERKSSILANIYNEILFNDEDWIVDIRARTVLLIFRRLHQPPGDMRGPESVMHPAVQWPGSRVEWKSPERKYEEYKHYVEKEIAKMHEKAYPIFSLKNFSVQPDMARKFADYIETATDMINDAKKWHMISLDPQRYIRESYF
jgi:hypothetical protein